MRVVKAHRLDKPCKGVDQVVETAVGGGQIIGRLPAEFTVIAGDAPGCGDYLTQLGSRDVTRAALVVDAVNPRSCRR